jgi:glycerophosphoryl diester phosphodiesterase
MLSPAFFSPRHVRSNTPIIVTGHRGAAGYAPENTLASIQKAMDLNVDRIEIDIHQTKDSVVVVIHDDSVDRTTNGTGLVADYTYRELRKLDAGSFFNEVYSDQIIPTLEDVLLLIDGKYDLLIEFKNGDDQYPYIEEHVVDLLNKYNAIDWCIVQSFNTKVLERMHAKLPSLRLHKLFVVRIRFTPIYITTGPEVFYPENYPYISEYSINGKFGNKNNIKKLHALGKKVNVWTINDKKQIEAYKKLNIDGIITDFPDLIR